LGPMITDLEGYPFDRMTARFGYRTTIAANWKLFMDAFQEFYHAPVLHAKQSPEKYSTLAMQAGFEAPHYRLDGPHRLGSRSGGAWGPRPASARGRGTRSGSSPWRSCPAAGCWGRGTRSTWARCPPVSTRPAATRGGWTRSSCSPTSWSCCGARAGTSPTTTG